MKLKHKIMLPFLLGGAFIGSLMTSCEDTCTGCDCAGFVVDKIVSSDSLDTGLGQLTSNTTVVVLGSGLSTVSQAYFIDAKENTYDIFLNPAYITDNSIIITLDSDADFKPTNRLVLKSKNGCEIVMNIEKPVPAPVVQRFRSEFVQAGDTLRIAGTAFLPTTTTPITVTFYKENGDSINLVSGLAQNESSSKVADDSKDKVRIKNDNKELLVEVPEGVADSKPIRVTTEFGTNLSPILFRDSRNIFIDFDTPTKTPVNFHGSMSLDGTPDAMQWDAAVFEKGNEPLYTEMLNKMGGKFPKPCSGKYSAQTHAVSPGDYMDFDNIIAYLQYKDYQTTNNLLGQFETEDLNNLVLKFEMLIPEEAKFGDVFYIIFSASKTEMEDMRLVLAAYPWASASNWHPRDLTAGNGVDTKEGWTCDLSIIGDSEKAGLPAAWFHPGKLDWSAQPAFKYSYTEASEYHTEGEWLTVAIPLNRRNFNAPVSTHGFTTIESIVACGELAKTDFYNFFISVDGCFTAKGHGNKFFYVAFDNFRIVPSDGGGTQFTRFDGVDPSAKYPYSIK